MKASRLEVRNTEVFDYEDALAITCLICGILINALLINAGLWQYDTLLQKALIYCVVSPCFGYAGFGIFSKIINFFERRK